MKESSSQYEHFIDYQVSKLEHYVTLLHELYQKKANLYDIIRNNKPYLIMIGFPCHIVEKLNDEVPAKLYNAYDYDFDDNAKYLMVRSTLVAYQHVVTTKIPYVLDKIKHHTFMMNISKKVFIELYKVLNYEILKHLLKGRVYEFTDKVGMLKIERFKRNFGKKVVNYGESNKLKKTNPDNYLVYHVDDEFAAVVYHKATARVPNYKYYTFKFSKFINGYDRNKYKFYDTVESIDQVYKDKQVGSFDKMLAVIHLHGLKHFDEYGV